MAGSQLTRDVSNRAGGVVTPDHRPDHAACRPGDGAEAAPAPPPDARLVLIADDDATLRMMAAEVMRCAGFAVVEASDGIEALSAVKEHQPDLVLMDVMMPGMDGFQACRAIREHLADDIVPVLMMTALDDLDSINKAYEAGATDFTTKPVNWVIIKERIRYMLRARQAAERLVKSEARNRALLHAIPDAMLLISRDGRLLEFKQSMGPSVFSSLAGEIGKPIVEVLPDELGGKISGSMETALFTGSVQLLEHAIPVNGDARHGEVRLVRVGEKGGEALAIIRDITERKRAEQALVASEAKFRLLVEHQTDLIIKTDSEGMILFASPSFCAYFEKDPADVMGARFTPVIHEKDRESTQRTMRSLHVPPYTGIMEHRVKAAGAWRWLSWSLTAVRDSRGNVDNIIGVARDITDKKSLEEQLTQSQKMEAVGTLAGGLAHDFNNLLQTILGYSELAISRKANHEDGRPLMEEIHKAATRGADLTRRLLTFSRRMETRKEAVRLNDLVADVQGLLTRTIGKSITIISRLGPGLVPIMADPVQVEQVLINLLLNARDAMPEGGTITVETCSVSLDESYCQNHGKISPGEYIMLGVSDTGSGMDEETRGRIFEPFFTTKGVGKGTGLGLSMVFGIIQNHGGHIDCRSRPGNGTVFSVYWPVFTVDQVGEADSVKEPDGRQGEEGALHGSETVLIVDDESSLRELISEYLLGYGYTILTAANGRDALEEFTAREGAVDLVVLDLNMPEMSGRECLEALRDKAPSVKILIATGELIGEDSRRELEEYTDGFIRKPYRINELLEHVRATLDDGGSRR